MQRIRTILILLTFFLLPGCAAVPFGIGLIPGAPSYFSSVIGNGQTAYETAVDERSTEQQMLDAIIAGHAQAEFYKHKEIRARQVIAYAYFGKLYLVGEYDSQEQLRKIYECADKVKDKCGIVSLLYLKEDQPTSDFLSEQAMATELKAQLMADFEVTSSPIDVEVVQGDIILLGVISDKAERDKIMAHALESVGDGRVISYLYHQENAGPEPRIMTAKLEPSKADTKPKRAKKKIPKRITPAEKAEKPKAVADSSPSPPLVVNGRVSGL
ncbi:BON domain-containing protein [Pseudodesulfovibrio sp. zrk46]|uniref:BON domain-containing protein n=1 Tax=Pseudodesulfovibrio sp. zrk46 TaxID=2725288 RepID=UPI00144A1F60|nr:BON domain-containing protein [Pseudodesulfovibrio sp. zrk46]QJB55225.1 BON domain-containing protein [Pseudodesulfovibrio sp. zrk46]